MSLNNHNIEHPSLVVEERGNDPVQGAGSGQLEGGFPVAHLVGKPGGFAHQPRQQQVLQRPLHRPDAGQLLLPNHGANLLVVLGQNPVVWMKEVKSSEVS